MASLIPPHSNRPATRQSRRDFGTRLAYAYNTVRIDGVDKVDAIIGVGFKTKSALTQGHLARIFPVRDPDIVTRQQAFDGFAQKRGVMARERRE